MNVIRPATPADLDPLARLWHDAWREAHLAHVPKALSDLRTLQNFRERLVAFGDRLRAAGPEGAPLGFCATKGAEIDQLYVAPAARGTGIAARLIEDGERRIAETGARRAHLFVLQENTRARTFYESMGWRAMRIGEEPVDTSEGPFLLTVLVMEKALGGVGG